MFYRDLLLDGLPADSITADQSQAARGHSLEKFRAGRTWVLVTTDLLARGIDFVLDTVVRLAVHPHVKLGYVARIGCRCMVAYDGLHLFRLGRATSSSESGKFSVCYFLGFCSYDFPQSTTDYVHRIGRTGRAGRTGALQQSVLGHAPKLAAGNLSIRHLSLLRCRPGSVLLHRGEHAGKQNVLDLKCMAGPTISIRPLLNCTFQMPPRASDTIGCSATVCEAGGECHRCRWGGGAVLHQGPPHAAAAVCTKAKAQGQEEGAAGRVGRLISGWWWQPLDIYTAACIHF